MRPTPKEVVTVVVVVGGGEVEQPLNSSRAGAGAGAAGSGSQGMNGICTMHVRSITWHRDPTIQRPWVDRRGNAGSEKGRTDFPSGVMQAIVTATGTSRLNKGH